jgi:hypothetical protein
MAQMVYFWFFFVPIRKKLIQWDCNDLLYSATFAVLICMTSDAQLGAELLGILYVFFQLLWVQFILEN